MITGMKKHTIAVLALVVLSGCASLFTTHFDTTRLSNLATLKVMHVKFLETWTEGSGNTWNEKKVIEACDKGDTSFREAHEYAKSTDLEDGTAKKAVNIVWMQFKADCSALLEDKALFDAGYSIDVKSRIEGNYDKAIEGEKSRIGYDK